MKTDRGRRSATILLFLTGLLALLIGCASLPSEPEQKPDAERRESPESPREVVRIPDVPRPTVQIEHLPKVPQPELQWRTTAPPAPNLLPAPTAPPASPPPGAGLDSMLPGLSAAAEPSPPAEFQERPEVGLQPPRSLVARESLPDWELVIPSLSWGDSASPESSDAAALANTPPPADRPTLTDTAAPADTPAPAATAVGDRAPPDTADAADGRDSAPGSPHNLPPKALEAPELDSSDMVGLSERASPSVAASPSASTSRRTPREDTTNERRVDPGEPFEVALPGQGWIYLGGGEALQFLDRTTEAGDVVFSFRGPSVDTAAHEATILQFESQNLTTGRRTRHEEQVMVAEAEAEAERAEPEDRQEADPSDLAADGDHSGVAGATAAGGIPENLTGATYEEFLQRLDELEAAEDHQAAVDLLQTMRSEAIGRDDELILRLAQLYEAEWGGRDLPRARELYHRVVENYPLSRWRRRAQERIEYLNRHFFHIR